MRVMFGFMVWCLSLSLILWHVLDSDLSLIFRISKDFSFRVGWVGLEFDFGLWTLGLV